MPKLIAENAEQDLRLYVKDEVVTRDVEAWMRAIREAKPKDGKASRFEDLAHTLRGALKAGIVVEPDLKSPDVSQLSPAHVRFYGAALEQFYLDITTIPNTTPDAE